ncbi:hypothetical protein [Nonomuraea sp. NPDC002799]
MRARGPGDAFAGVGALIRLIVRRDRLLLLTWIAVAVALPLFNAYSLAALLPTPEARTHFAEVTSANPVTEALLGPLRDTSIEGIVAWRSSLQCLLVMGLAGLLFAIRHTRAEEDAGRRELTAAGAVGRHASITAVVTVVAAVSVAVTVLPAAALTLGPGYDLAGSALFGLTPAASGVLFAACGLVTAQLAQSAALARTTAVGMLAAGVLPGFAVPVDEIVFLPANWPRLAAPYAAGRWWVPLVPLALAAVLILVACALSARRDLGAGLLPDRAGSTGPVRAGARLGSPMALIWRLYGGTAITWSVTLATISVAVGWVSASVGAVFGGLLTIEVYTYVLCLVVAPLTAVSALRPHAEERAGRASPLLATPTGRVRWLAGHVTLALAAPAGMLLAVGAGTGLGHGLTMGRPGAILTQVGAALLFLPAAWTITGVTIAVYGLRPRLATPAGWVTVAGSVAFVALWEAGTIGRTAFLLTPFGYGYPAISPGPAAPAAFALVAAALIVTGGATFARRDLLA